MFDGGIAIAFLFAAVTRSLTGTFVSIGDPREPSAAPSNREKITVNAERQFQTFAVAGRAVIERESRFAGGGAATTTRIDLSDLTPGEHVKLERDAQGRVTHVRAIASVERAKVRSVSGASVVLQDGTTLTIGSVLRFVTAEGKPSATATVRPRETVLLFRNPETRNIYRFSAEARPKPHGSAGAGKRATPPRSPRGEPN